MDMKEASAMTEASGLIDDQDAVGAPRRSGETEAPETRRTLRQLQTRRRCAGRAAAQGDGAGSNVPALRRVPPRHLGRAPALGRSRWDADNRGKEAQDIRIGVMR